MRYPVILMALALPVLVVADRAPSPPAPRQGAAAPAPSAATRYSPEQLQRLRQSLVAQIAVRDDAEGVRAATDQEAAELAAAVPAADQAVVALPGGGIGLRTDGSQWSLAVAEMAEDGRVRLGERAPGSGAHGSTVKGGAHVR